jgi:hypothetical protein
LSAGERGFERVFRVFFGMAFVFTAISISPRTVVVNMYLRKVLLPLLAILVFPVGAALLFQRQIGLMFVKRVIRERV